MTWKRMKRLMRHDSTLKSLYEWSPPFFSRLLHLSSSQALHVYRYLHATNPKHIRDQYKTRNIEIITPLHEAYPKRLLQIYDPPWVLYGKGDISLLHASSLLAVVGTRTPTDYGTQALKHLLPPLIKKKVPIVSGLATGIDGLSHSLAIKHSGKTVAVLGSGFDYIYPREHKKLANTIASEHLLLSEYSPSTPPRKWQFPARNRIISGLADLIFIVEAGERSGSLITAYQALEQGKEVRVLPGSIFSPYSKGTNTLIEEGAAPVLTPEHLWLDIWEN
ncbi:DNA-processing protein DprA [Alteribacillus iranensis]|nr:DNA-processing protein DprA [Alteribacillus iranensis]